MIFCIGHCNPSWRGTTLRDLGSLKHSEPQREGPTDWGHSVMGCQPPCHVMQEGWAFKLYSPPTENARERRKNISIMRDCNVMRTKRVVRDGRFVLLYQASREWRWIFSLVWIYYLSSPFKWDMWREYFDLHGYGIGTRPCWPLEI